MQIESLPSLPPKKRLQELLNFRFSALKGLAKVVGAKASIPVLGHVRLKAANGNVSITGTNLEEWLTCEMDAETENSADWLLDFAKLKDFLKGDGKVFVGIEVAGDRTVKIAFDAGGHLVERIFGGKHAPIARAYQPLLHRNVDVVARLSCVRHHGRADPR